MVMQYGFFFSGLDGDRVTKDRAVPQPSVLPTLANRCFVRKSPIRAVYTAKSYQ